MMVFIGPSDQRSRRSLSGEIAYFSVHLTAGSVATHGQLQPRATSCGSTEDGLPNRRQPLQQRREAVQESIPIRVGNRPHFPTQFLNPPVLLHRIAHVASREKVLRFRGSVPCNRYHVITTSDVPPECEMTGGHFAVRMIGKNIPEWHGEQP